MKILKNFSKNLIALSQLFCTSSFLFIALTAFLTSGLLIAKPTPTPEKQINIVMDLGGVTLSTDKSAFLKHIGKWNGFKAWLNQDKMRDEMFALFEAVKPRNDKDKNAKDDRGRPLPQLMIDWMKGDIQGTEALTLIEKFLKENPTSFKSNDINLLKNLIQVMFDHEKFVDTQKIYCGACEFAQSCKKRGYNVYVMSNWPNTSTLLQEKHNNFFNLCDGIILSADAHELKPNKAIYDFFIKKMDCEQATTILIDDQIDNVKGAEKAGWHGILCLKNDDDNPDFEEVDTKLRTLVKSIAPEHPSVKPPLVVVSQDNDEE
jgi:putative hydrolase of the HAD superfamily